MVFETGDDAICVKSGKNEEARAFEGPCENVYIHDCLVNEGHGGFVVGSEMSRGVKNILVEKCTFLGTDVGVRFKSAMGRGGIVENIQIQDINMVEIKNEAVILTMSYVLNMLNRSEELEEFQEADIPYFRNILFDHISCMGANYAVKVEPVAGKPETISNITIKNSWFHAENENIIQNDEVTIENTIFE
jgi:hypothetical protein